MSGPAIGPGDWVECVRTSALCPVRKSDRRTFKVGAVYRVSDCGTAEGFGWLNCEGCVRPVDCGLVNTPGWAVECFRPIWRGDKSLIETLLEPVSTDAPRVFAMTGEG